MSHITIHMVIMSSRTTKKPSGSVEPSIRRGVSPVAHPEVPPDKRVVGLVIGDKKKKLWWLIHVKQGNKLIDFY